MSGSSLDHLVLPVTDLAVARERLTALGFTVAPDGHHPFGTSNACVYFSDGTFIEPLAVTNTGEAAKASAGGNVFVMRDAIFRLGVGPEGISALVLATEDAEADHARFVKQGISAGPMLEFRRAFVDADGVSDEAIFRLAFAAPALSTASYFFTCQRIRSPNVDREALQRHANGVTKPCRTFWADKLREEAEDFFDLFLELPKNSVRAFVDRRLAGGFEICVNNHEAFKSSDLGSGVRELGVYGRAVQFECKDLDATRLLLEANGVEHHLRGENIIVPPAPGQGVTFIFGKQT